MSIMTSWVTHVRQGGETGPAFQGWQGLAHWAAHEGSTLRLSPLCACLDPGSAVLCPKWPQTPLPVHGLLLAPPPRAWLCVVPPGEHFPWGWCPYPWGGPGTRGRPHQTPAVLGPLPLFVPTWVWVGGPQQQWVKPVWLWATGVGAPGQGHL